jgi:imidazolonepropionase-like amidohydrolase
MRYLREAGLSPLRIVQASTQHAAVLCGQSATLGVLAPGRRADLIVVDGDPLADLDALRRIRIVIKDGRLTRRTEDAVPTGPGHPVPTEPPR